MPIHRAVVKVCLEPHLLEAVKDALEAEVRQPAAPSKGRVAVSLEGGCLTVEVESESLSGLRALLNSYIYLTHAALSSLWEASRARL
jgi:tRNA threonylcarbamoyladenosine modification (KEOPS) complex  Pcc1 subunit